VRPKLTAVTVLLCAAILAVCVDPAPAAITIQVDEKGNWSIDPSGLSMTSLGKVDDGYNQYPLGYTMPFTPVYGYVIMTEPGGGWPGTGCSDGIWFRQIAQPASQDVLLFYSDSGPGDPPEPGDLADTLYPPPIVEGYPIVMISEVSAGGWSYATYTPGAGQPGYNSDFLPTYVFISEVPEPATILVWSLLGMGSWLGMRVWRRRRGGPGGRQPWSNDNRTAIHDIIAHGTTR